MKAMDAIILAGEKEGAIPVMGTNKAFLPVGGKTLLGVVVDAVDRAEFTSSITVVGPREKLEPALAGIKTLKPLRFLEQGDNIFENIWRGALSTFPEYSPGMSSEDLRSSCDPDKAVVALTCDMPLLLPLEVNRFIETVPLDRADFVFGVTRRWMLKPFEPSGDKPGIKFIYFCLRDRLVRHANIFCFRPLKLAHVMETYVPIIYRLRYQRHFRNMVAATGVMMKFAFNPSATPAFLLLQAASYFHNHGCHRLREIFRRPLSLEYSEKVISGIIQTRFAAHETIGPGLTLDVDDDASYQAFLAMSEPWKDLQKELIEKAIADRDSQA